MTESKQTKQALLEAAGIAEKYSEAKNRLILLDYDGTLTPLMPLPELAAPGKDLLELLYRLSHDSRNTVYIISGREYLTLGKWLGHLPLNLVAEHGAWVKAADFEWNTAAPLATEWMISVKNLFENYSSKCEGSFVELKSYSIAWHYRNADSVCISSLYDSLITELETLGCTVPFNIIKGNKVVEAKNAGVNKGTAVERILSDKGFDFILACGDDTTDEDMFRQLAETENAYTVKVGADKSLARLTIANTEVLLHLLKQFVN